MSTESITGRATRGATWLLSWRVLTRLIGLVSTLVLARLLKPADFGLMALGMAMFTAMGAVSNLGVEEQLIRFDNPDKAFYDTAFTLNLIRVAVVAAVLVGCSGPIAGFFGDRNLIPIVLTMAALLVLSGLQNIWVYEYRRNIDFSKDFRLAAVSRVISSALTIGTAFIFRDYRALIVGVLSGTVVATVYSYRLHPNRPGLSLRRWRDMTSFSVWSWCNGIIAFFRNRVDTIIVARVLGSAAVGIYAVAMEIATLPFSELLGPFAGVLFSSFAAVRQAGSGLDSAYARAVGGAWLLVLPATVGTAFIAEPAVALTFGSKWMAAAPLIRLLALTGAMTVGSMIGAQLLSSAGWPRINVQINVVATAVRLPLIALLTLRYGLVGAAEGVLAGVAVEEFLFIVVTMRRCHVRFATLFAQVWRPATASAAMALALAATGGWWSTASLAKLAALRSLGIAVPEGAAVYAVSLLALWLLAGRPNGAEVEIAHHGLRMVGSVFRATRRRLVPVIGGAR